VKNALGWPELRRCAASCEWDLEILGENPVEVLVTRPDFGRNLVTMRLDDFAALWEAQTKKPGLRIECKRYAKMAHHTIFEDTYPERRETPPGSDGT